MNKLYEESNIQAIANAIRNKGQTGTFKVSEMANAIGNIQTGIEPESYEWQQTTIPVQRYLDEVDYTDVPYTSSQIATYTALGAGERPVGKTITTQAGTLERDGYKLSVSSGNTTLYNDIPQKKTEFSVFNGTVKQVGQLKPTKPLRQIQCTTHNVRDLGGWQCDGGTIKYGKIFRGAEVSSSGDLDIFLNQLGIRAELELQGEEGSQVLVLSNEVDYCCPIKQGDIYWAYYTLANKTQMKEAFRFIFESIKRNHALYFHCAVGADRTGTIACLIESLLGVNESDIDKDYELTSFYSQRLRTSSDWKNLINQINALSGDTRQQKVANYLATMGFTEDEINEFVEEMVDGTPTHIDIDVDTLTITNNLSHATSDNSATSITQYQPYEANIKADRGYAINSVQILMGGVDITDQVWSGTETSLYRSITKALSNCSIDNTKSAVLDGEGFGAELTANDGYTFDGGTIQILMNGVDITKDVWVAYEELPKYTNLAEPSSPDWLNDTRLSTSGTSSHTGSVVTNYIPCKPNDIIRIKGLNPKSINPSVETPTEDGDKARYHTCNSSKVVVARTYGYFVYTIDVGKATDKDSNGVYTLTAGWQCNDSMIVPELFEQTAYVRLCGTLVNTADDVIITVNEEIK